MRTRDSMLSGLAALAVLAASGGALSAGGSSGVTRRSGFRRISSPGFTEKIAVNRNLAPNSQHWRFAKVNRDFLGVFFEFAPNIIYF